MQSVAADLAQRLGERAEAVCHHYLPNGIRRGDYWLVGDVTGAKGKSLFVRLLPSAKAAAGKWKDASTGQYGDLLDLIQLNRNLPSVSDAIEEARAFLCEPPKPAPKASNSNRPKSETRSPSEGAARLFALHQPRSRHACRDLSARPCHHRRSRSARAWLSFELPLSRRGYATSRASFPRSLPALARLTAALPACIAPGFAMTAPAKRMSPNRASRSASCLATVFASAFPTLFLPRAKALRPCWRCARFCLSCLWSPRYPPRTSAPCFCRTD